MNKRITRSRSAYAVPSLSTHSIKKDSKGIYTKCIYQDLLKIRNQAPLVSRNGVPILISANTSQPKFKYDKKSTTIKTQLTEEAIQKIENIAEKRKQIHEIEDENNKISAGFMSERKERLTKYPIDDYTSPAKILTNKNNFLSERKNNVNALCQEEENVLIVPQKSSLSIHFIGSNTKKYKIKLRKEKENSNKNDKELEKLLKCDNNNVKDIPSLVHGTAEFNNNMQIGDKESEYKTLLKEKNTHIDILRKLLSKSMKIIKSFHDQIGLLSPNKEAAKNSKFEQLDKLLTEDFNDRNLDQIGKFLDALHESSNEKNKNILSQKVELIAEKYGEEAKSLAENLIKLTNRTYGGGTNQFISPSKTPLKSNFLAKIMDMSLSPIQTPCETSNQVSVRNGITELCKDAEDETEKKKSISEDTKQMTFQQEEEENTSENCQTYEDTQKEDRHAHNNKSCATSKKKKYKAKEIIPNKNTSVESNIAHIETAMNNFIGGFKDIKNELSQIGEAMQSCSPTSLLK